MTKLQQVNKIVIKMLNKHENYRKESINVAIDRKFKTMMHNDSININQTNLTSNHRSQNRP
jgi:hypothetical protein